MSDHPVHIEFSGRIVMIGCGSIGQGVFPLLFRHVGITPDRITIITADNAGLEEAAEYGVRFLVHPLTRENYQQVLKPLLRPGDFLLNLSVDVSSLALIELAHAEGVL